MERPLTMATLEHKTVHDMAAWSPLMECERDELMGAMVDAGACCVIMQIYANFARSHLDLRVVARRGLLGGFHRPGERTTVPRRVHQRDALRDGRTLPAHGHGRRGPRLLQGVPLGYCRRRVTVGAHAPRVWSSLLHRSDLHGGAHRRALPRQARRAHEQGRVEVESDRVTRRRRIFRVCKVRTPH